MLQTPRTSGTLLYQWLCTSSQVRSMVPSGRRTAQQIFCGPRIIMPSIRA